MSDSVDPTQDIWRAVRHSLREDERITPQLQGFLSLVEAGGGTRLPAGTRSAADGGEVPSR